VIILPHPGIVNVLPRKSGPAASAGTIDAKTHAAAIWTASGSIRREPAA
jgi:hypothetical protein